MRNNHNRGGNHLRDRLQILQRIVGQFGVKTGRDGDVRSLPQHQRITIRRRLRGDAQPQRATTTGPVVGHHLHAPQLGEFSRDHARNEIRAAARREGHHPTHRFGRIALRDRGGCTRQQYSNE